MVTLTFGSFIKNIIHNYVHAHAGGTLQNTVVWEIFVFNNFRMLKFGTGNFRTTEFVRKIFKRTFYPFKNVCTFY